MIRFIPGVAQILSDGYTTLPINTSRSTYMDLEKRFRTHLSDPDFQAAFPWVKAAKGADIPTQGFMERTGRDENGEVRDHKYFLHITPELLQSRGEVGSEYATFIDDCAHVQAEANRATEQFMVNANVPADLISGRSTLRLLAYKNVGQAEVSAQGHFDKGLLTGQLYASKPGLRILKPGSPEPNLTSNHLVESGYNGEMVLFPGPNGEEQLGLPQAWHDVMQTANSADSIWRFSIINFYEPIQGSRIEFNTHEYIPAGFSTKTSF